MPWWSKIKSRNGRKHLATIKDTLRATLPASSSEATPSVVPGRVQIPPRSAPSLWVFLIPVPPTPGLLVWHLPPQPPFRHPPCLPSCRLLLKASGTLGTSGANLQQRVHVYSYPASHYLNNFLNSKSLHHHALHPFLTWLVCKAEIESKAGQWWPRAPVPLSEGSPALGGASFWAGSLPSRCLALLWCRCSCCFL